MKATLAHFQTCRGPSRALVGRNLRGAGLGTYLCVRLPLRPIRYLVTLEYRAIPQAPLVPWEDVQAKSKPLWLTALALRRRSSLHTGTHRP